MNRETPVPVVVPVGSPSLIYSENQTQTDITNLTQNLFSDKHNIKATFVENETITNMIITKSNFYWKIDRIFKYFV